MNAQEEIKCAQKKWAEWKPKTFHSRRFPYHLKDIGSNLMGRSLSDRAQQGFGEGRGSECRDTEREPAKMKALYSSSVLVVNFFDYWTYREKTPLLQALGIEAHSTMPLDFEAKFPTGLKGTPPHLDVVITLDSGHVIAIESKFTEPFESVFSSSYFPSPDNLWESKGWSKCRELAEELHERSNFHPEQLLKHALGLAKKHRDNFCLYYLYYDWRCKESENHKEEISRFKERVGKELRFKALSYQDVYSRLCDFLKDDPEHKAYLDYLGERYFSGKGGPK